MSNRNIKSGHGLKIEGFLNIDIINKKNNVHKVYKNTITNAGKQYFLDKCAGNLLRIAADTFGMTAGLSAISTVGSSSETPFPGRTSRADSCLTNVLLNLGDEANSLTGSTTFINVYDENMDEASKVVGYANSNITPTVDGKEGSIDYCKGEYVIDPYTVCERWKYPEGVASGTIDTIAMMPGACVKTKFGHGLCMFKCLDKINKQYTNFTRQSDGFLIPGVAGFTGNDEILLNFEQDGNSRWKFSLTTGEITAVPAGDNFFVVLAFDEWAASSAYYLYDMYYDNGYLYVLRGQYAPNGGSGYYGAYLHVFVYNMTSGGVLVTNYALNAPSGGNNQREQYISGAKFLKVSSSLYVTTWSYNIRTDGYDPSSQKVAKLWKLSSSGAYFDNVEGTAQSDFSSIGFNLPSGLKIYDVGLGSYGTSYIMYMSCRLNNISDSTNTGKLSFGIVFTSLSDPIGSATGALYGLGMYSVAFSAGSNRGILKIGAFNDSSPDDTTGTEYFNNYYDVSSALKMIENNTNPETDSSSYFETGEKVSCVGYGVWLSLDGWSSNVLSFVKLNTPIEKGDDDIMYVSYGYKVV